MSRSHVTEEDVWRFYGIDGQYATEIADAMNCTEGGKPNVIGHSQCGLCADHHAPMKVCGCRHEYGTGKRIPMPSARDAEWRAAVERVRTRIPRGTDKIYAALANLADVTLNALLAAMEAK